jgi:sRNA-binding protein
MPTLIDTLLGLIALIAGIAALALVLDLRGRVVGLEAAQHARRQLDADAQAAREAMHAEVSHLRHELEATQHELAELKAATEVMPAPPLPKGRPAGLDDLREQLRASHLDPESGTEDS